MTWNLRTTRSPTPTSRRASPSWSRSACCSRHSRLLVQRDLRVHHRPGRGDRFPAAFREARPHWRFVSGLALLTGGLQAGIWLLVPHVQPRWLWLALLAMFVVQVYLFIAIPSWLLGVRKSGTRRERTIQSMTTGVLSGVASTPGFLLNRIGLLLLGTSSGSSASSSSRSAPCCTYRELVGASGQDVLAAATERAGTSGEHSSNTKRP